MHCPRCGGMMVSEFVSDLHNVWQEDQTDMWRCVSCGEMIDPLVMINRKKAKETLQVH
jgi:uncharacterized Zn finger protein